MNRAKIVPGEWYLKDGNIHVESSLTFDPIIATGHSNRNSPINTQTRVENSLKLMTASKDMAALLNKALHTNISSQEIRDVLRKAGYED